MKKTLLLTTICFIIFGCFLFVDTKEEYANPYINRASMIEGLKSIKVSEEKVYNNKNNIYINARIPIISYKNTNIQQCMNNTIKTDIMQFINKQKQKYIALSKSEKLYIEVNYHIMFEDADILNLVVLRKIGSNKNEYSLYKDSYVFDLNTGQQIHLENFLKENKDYKEVISKYILSYINKHNLPYNKNRIKINNDTNYYLLDDGIIICLNPYQDSKEKIDYQFKLPYEIFKNKIKKVRTKTTSSQISTKHISEKENNLNIFLDIPVVQTKDTAISKGINEKIQTICMNFYNEVRKQSQIYNHEIKYNANQTYKVKKNSNDILSLYLEFYQEASGAHGDYYGLGYNVDLIDGVEINLKDLFKTNVDYKNIINKNINKQINSMDKEEKEVYQFNGISENQKYYLQDGYIVVFFDLYEIAPYPAGTPEFKIKIDDIKNNINEKYINRI